MQTEAEEKKLREASLAASGRLKRALLKEKEAKDSLQKALNEIQARGICLVHVSLKIKKICFISKVPNQPCRPKSDSGPLGAI